MNLALILDALITHPHYREIVTELQALAPSGFADQATAASQDAAQLSEALAALSGAGPFRRSHPDPAQVPDWLRLSTLDALAGWLTGAASTCRHSPDPGLPQPVFAAAWRPGLITCAACMHLLTLRSGSVADSTCDACGHHCTGPDDGDGVYPAMTQIGALVFQYGVCEGCRRDAQAVGGSR
jgi:hypothetical protein